MNPYETPILLNRIKKLQQDNEDLKEECTYQNLWREEYLNRIDKAIKLNQYIIDYGFDYDGFNNVEDFKGLIDTLVDYAIQVKDILGDKE